ncbi:MAG: metalloregulator ArsR/SmtB family transcription factor [Ahrensia sp.]|nr:metalloregulator ArsR/SmtB family transcription factor [Ahrensia sp.]
MSSDPFYAISDPTRRYLLETLRIGPKSVNELAKDLPISRPAVSQHLKILLDANLVAVTAQNTSRIYRLDDLGFMRLNIWIDQFWSEDQK